MSKLVRLSVSLEAALARQLDDLATQSHCANRSEFVRDLIRDRLVADEWAANEEALGTITLIYDHHQRQLNEKLIHIQHENPHAILAATHVHLNHQLCAEMIMMQAQAGAIRRMADLLGRQKGILHCALAMSSTGKQLAQDHQEAHRHSHGHSHTHPHAHPHTHEHRTSNTLAEAKTTGRRAKIKVAHRAAPR